MQKILKKALSIFIIPVFLVLLVLTVPASALSETITIGGIKWTYSVNSDGETCTIEKCSNQSTNISIPSTITKDGIEYTVTIIGNGTSIFNNTNMSTRTISIPNSVIEIKAYAFSNCTNLENITIPASVNEIENYVFDGCTALTAISVNAANETYSSEDGVLFNKAKTTLIKYPEGKSAETYVVPDSVTTIKQYAFSKCTALKSVIIPDSVTSFENQAFDNCTSLISVTIGNSVQAISGYTFRGCENLASLTIGNSVKSIGDKAFENCSKLISIDIPGSVTNLNSSAFSGCTSLAAINVASENTKYSSEAGVLFDKGKTKLIMYPMKKADDTYNIPNTVAIIDENSFLGCTSLASIDIPNSVTTIGRNAFSGCSGLTSVNIPNSVNSLGDSSFLGCSSLTKVIIGNSVNSIAHDTFSNCTALASVYFKGDAPQPLSFNDSAFADVSADLILYYSDRMARWSTPTKKWNTIAFNTSPTIAAVSFVNGGSEFSFQVLTPGEKAIEPAAPTKTGHTFAGWYKDAAYNNAWNFATDTMGTSNITLHAKWDVNNYNVNFMYYNGSPLVTQSIPYDTTVTEPEAPTKPGHIFDGWYKDAAYNNVWNFATDKVPAANITLHAKWAAVKYNVTFNSNSGSAVEAQLIAFDNMVTEPEAPTKAGYTFQGWYKDAALNNAWNFAEDTVPSNDITLYAKWAINSYTVTFNSNDGSSCPAQTLEYGTAVVKPADPVKPGYTFAGWYKDPAFNTPWNFASDTVGASDFTLYARWTGDSYQVTFITYSETSIPPQTLEEGDTVVRPADPIKAGHTFAGWYKDPAFNTPWNFASDTVGASDFTLYARWISDSYQVTFITYSETSIPPQTLEEGAAVVRPADPIKTGYTFAGWYKDPAFNTPWNFSSDTVGTADITLYAKWSVNSYTVSFNSNDGSSCPDQILEYGAAVVRPADPVKEGYIFAGWYKDPAFNTAWDFTSDTVGASDIVLYARWTSGTYQVTFNTNGGSYVPPQMLEVGEAVAMPADPVKPDHTFAGWYKDTDFIIPWNFSTDTIGTSDIILYAKWTRSSYIVTFNTNGGTYVPPQTLTEGAAVVMPADPVKTGYIFEGWYKDAYFNAPWNFSTDTIGTSDIILYAKWTRSSYIVTFNTNGGTYVPPQTLAEGAAVVMPADPVKTGYIFEGWYKDAFLNNPWNFSTDTIGASDITLYAKWRAVGGGIPGGGIPGGGIPGGNSGGDTGGDTGGNTGDDTVDDTGETPDDNANPPTSGIIFKIISVPFTPVNSAPDKFVATYIDANGVKRVVPNGHYDADTGKYVYALPQELADVEVTIEESAAAVPPSVPADHWGYSAISYLYDRNVITESTLEPDALLTRGDLIKFLAQATCGLDVKPYSSEPSRFTDVPDDSAYKAFLNWAHDAGIVTGYEDGAFKPENNISREEVCVTLMRFLNFYTAFKVQASSDISFADQNSFNDWSKDYIQSLTRQGLIKGIPTNDGGVVFMPKKGMAYAEAAAILYRILTA